VLAANGDDDVALLEEGVAHRDRLREEPSRVPAQVDHQSRERAAVQALEPREMLVEAARRVLVELLDRDVSDALAELLAGDRLGGRTEELRLDALDLDSVALDGDRDRLELVLLVLVLVLHLAPDGQDDLRAAGAPNLPHGLHDGHVDRRLIVDLDDDVVLLESGALRGGLLENGVHLEPPELVGSDHHADAEDVPFDVAFELVEALRREDERVGVDAREIAVRRGVAKLLERGVAVVVALEELEHRLEEADHVGARPNASQLEHLD